MVILLCIILIVHSNTLSLYGKNVRPLIPLYRVSESFSHSLSLKNLDQTKYGVVLPYLGEFKIIYTGLVDDNFVFHSTTSFPPDAKSQAYRYSIAILLC